ncbi:hypothetical protein CA54_35260 [Symmachiella macrocystis]|uniref:Uncharacterized protein n=1 Tax=Symmachiella macrocystis TaxID=2527985 RepID=A0A5C6BSA4_9PLAN|nr:hypothetical protein [Symmachiella macrocystis]TWU14657.1 hypothetical protein CA54_35260 [Symmachiella macrocystis]
MQLVGNDSYHIFPSLIYECQDMSTIKREWAERRTDGWHFQPGQFGGGILAQPRDIPERSRNGFARPDGLDANLMYPHGMVLGNEAGEKLSNYVNYFLPIQPPAFAIDAGLAKRYRTPTVAFTAEHADCLTDERYLLVLPKVKRKTLKLLDQLPVWLSYFGIDLDLSSSVVPQELRDEMHDWFDDPDRTMWAFPISGGEPNAAWQLAVIYYIALHWDVNITGLNNIHFIANIEGRPNFRKNWTSNR